MKSLLRFVATVAIVTGAPIFVTGELLIFNALGRIWGYGCLPVGPCEFSNSFDPMMQIPLGLLTAALGAAVAILPTVLARDALEVLSTKESAS